LAPLIALRDPKDGKTAILMPKPRLWEDSGNSSRDVAESLALTQKDVAAGIVRDDGKPLSVQYLNDIEHGRRGAPPDYDIGQLAKLLRVEIDVLYCRAGRLPRDIRKRSVSDRQEAAAYRALRRELRPPAKS
jgi:transcriptional regulator with XRE-family HTH domain